MSMQTTPLEAAQAARPAQPGGIRIAAHVLSYVFHPLFIPTYVTAFLLYVDPYAFAGMSDKFKMFRLLSVLVNTAFIPAFSVFLMWRLGLIQSIFMRTQKERIIPYAAALIFYFWAWYVFHRQPDNPDSFTNFLLGSFLAVCVAWFFNILTKISMHALAMGGFAMFFLLQAFSQQDVTGFYFSIAILIAGMVCTARLIVSDHFPREIYFGFVMGALCQVVAMWLG
jgi:hypothetical protein